MKGFACFVGAIIGVPLLVSSPVWICHIGYNYIPRAAGYQACPTWDYYDHAADLAERHTELKDRWLSAYNKSDLSDYLSRGEYNDMISLAHRLGVPCEFEPWTERIAQPTNWEDAGPRANNPWPKMTVPPGVWHRVQSAERE